LQRLDQIEECFLVYARSLANEPIVRLILDGTVVPVLLERKATSMWLLVCRDHVAAGLPETGGQRYAPFHPVSLAGPRPDPLPTAEPPETRSPTDAGGCGC
jgi:hypothetical protein